MKEATLIYNPLAGPARLTTSLEDFVDFWRGFGWAVQVKETQYAGHAIELAQNASSAGKILVMAVGGDGTLSEVAHGLAHSDSIMVPVPSGLGNTFARDINLQRPRQWKRSTLIPIAKDLVAGQVISVDLGRCDNGRLWLLWAGVGIDSYTIGWVNPRRSRAGLMRRLSRLAYAINCVRRGVRFRGMKATVRVEGQSHTGDFLLISISNSRYLAGDFRFNPTAVLDDGLFEVLLFRGHNTLDAIRHILSIVTGYRYPDGERVMMVRGCKAEVETDVSFPYQLDGDLCGKTPFSVELQPRALRILVPANIISNLTLFPGKSLSESVAQGSKSIL